MSQEEKNAYNRAWREDNKDRINEQRRVRYAENPRLREVKHNYHKNNKERISEWHRERHIKNKEHDNKRTREWCANQKLLALQKISQQEEPTCKICGEENLTLLTIDHINNDGKKWRIARNGIKQDTKIYKIINQNKISPEEFLSLQVLCYNCNCSKQRDYFDIPPEEWTNMSKDQKYMRKYQIKLWHKALEFFGPCPTCGSTNIKHLTISHINNNGAEMRKNGQNRGVILLANFNKQGWPESLKEDYCLECYNCNCSRKINSNQ